jgi:putative endonuclease
MDRMSSRVESEPKGRAAAEAKARRGIQPAAFDAALTQPDHLGVMPDRLYAVYILASHSRVLYVGSTSDLVRRVYQHRTRSVKGFTQRYDITRLVFFEQTPNSRAAVEREQELKGWRRAKKVRLIESVNPGWLDLAADWFEPGGDAQRSTGSCRVDPSPRPSPRPLRGRRLGLDSG